MARIIDGNKIAASIKAEVAAEVETLKSRGIEISLSIIIVGDDPASRVYMERKVKALQKVGIQTRVYEFPGDAGTEDITDLIGTLNDDESCNGIFVEMPLPKGIDTKRVIMSISPDKDVDGLHPVNIGRLCTGDDGFVCCTPYGVIELLKRSDIDIEGKSCVIAGRSNIVGKPMALLMLRENATVTIAHSRTPDLKEVCRKADILILATGRAKMFGPDYVGEGAVLIDVGTNATPDGKLCGDADYDAVFDKCSAITPVPGGVGSMTVAILMKNVLKAANRSI